MCSRCLFWHGIPLGVDFRGRHAGLCEVLAHAPTTNAIRAALDQIGLHRRPKIQRYDQAANNEVLIDLDGAARPAKQALDKGKAQIIEALETNAPAGKVDLNNASSLTIKNYLLEKDPLHAGHRR